MDATHSTAEPADSIPATRMGRWAWNWLPAIAMMATIFAISGTPNLGAVPGGVSDKAGHFVGYALLGGLLLRAFARVSWDGVNGRTGAAAWGVGLLYGASDEFHQHFVPGRSVAFDDWIADALGAGAAVLVLAIVAYGHRLEGRKV